MRLSSRRNVWRKCGLATTAGVLAAGCAGPSTYVVRVPVADVRAQVMLSLFTDFENFTVFKPAAIHEKSVHTMLDQVVAWGGALKALRAK